MRLAATPANAATVLIADDDRQVRETLAAALGAAGYTVHVAPADAGLDARIADGAWDVLVVDMAAKSVLRHLVDTPSPPVRILISEALNPEDAVAGLQDFEADVCLAKPIHAGVLKATIDALRRRVAASAAPAPLVATPRRGEEGRVWRLCSTDWTVTCPCGAVVVLAHAEIEFMSMLAAAPGTAVPRRKLIEAMGHNTEYYNSRRLDTFVSRLRNKISAACAETLPLRSVHAVGYAFVAPIRIIGADGMPGRGAGNARTGRGK